MSGKVAVPLIAGAAAVAALYLLTGKEEKRKSPRRPSREPAPSDLKEAKLRFDQECNEIISKLEGMEAEHDTWLTNRHDQLYGEGMTDPTELATQLLKDQGPHCPWDDKSKWTPLMKELHSQLLTGVQEWQASMG